MKNIATRLMLTLALYTLLTAPAATKQRIISAGAGITELIYALEAEGSLIAVDSTSRDLVAGTSIPQVGYHRQLSTEGLLALGPTHLIGSDEMGPEATLSQLESANVQVIRVPSGEQVSDLYARIDTIASITGSQVKADELKSHVALSIRELQQQALTNKPTMIFLLINEGRPLSVAGSETSVDQIISLAGGFNPAHDAMTSYKPLSLEAIVGMQPEYILVSQRTWQQLAGIDGILQHYPLLQATPAGVNGSIIPIPGTALIGGLGLQSIQLAKTLRASLLDKRK